MRTATGVALIFATVVVGGAVGTLTARPEPTVVVVPVVEEPGVPTRPVFDWLGVVPVNTVNGIGHVCPVGPKRAVTAAHVTLKDESFFGRTTHLLTFDDGVLREVSHSLSRDVAMVEPVVGEFKSFYRLATTEPVAGETLWLAGYNHDSHMERKLYSVTVTEVRAGHILYDGSGLGGSSGSCLLRADGSVVGINTGQWGTPTPTGAGVLLVGEWGVNVPGGE